MDRKNVIMELEDSMKSAGIIIFVTVVVGARTGKAAGVGDYVPMVLLLQQFGYFITIYHCYLSTICSRLGTVAMITAAVLLLQL